MSIIEALLWAIIIGLVGGSGVAMYVWFDIVGVAVLAVFLLPIIGVLVYVSGGNGGSATNTTRQSKGARER